MKLIVAPNECIILYNLLNPSLYFPQITTLLDQHGAKRDPYLSDMVSHVIADNTASDFYSEAKELFELPIVTVSFKLFLLWRRI